MLFTHAQKFADANDQGAYIIGLADKNVIDITDLIIGGIIDSLLIEVSHGSAGGHFCEDLGGPRSHWRRLLRHGRYTDPHCEHGCCGCRDELSHVLLSPQGLGVRRGHARCGIGTQSHLSTGDPSLIQIKEPPWHPYHH
jgi:hypothetical protein